MSFNLDSNTYRRSIRCKDVYHKFVDEMFDSRTGCITKIKLCTAMDDSYRTNDAAALQKNDEIWKNNYNKKIRFCVNSKDIVDLYFSTNTCEGDYKN